MCTSRGVSIIFALTCISMVNTEIDNVHYGFTAAGHWLAIVAAQMFSQRVWTTSCKMNEFQGGWWL